MTKYLRADIIGVSVLLILSVLAFLGSPFAIVSILGVFSIGVWRNVWPTSPADDDIKKIVSQLNAVSEKSLKLQDEIQKLSLGTIIQSSGFEK